jgi:hypothetical protein
MKTQNKNKTHSVEVLIPFFCYCCAPGSHKLADDALKKLTKSKHKIFINPDVIKREFEYVKDLIQNPSEFNNSINFVLYSLNREYSKTESSILTNSIKRIISLIAKDMELEETQTNTTTNLIISKPSTYQKFIQYVLEIIDNLKGIVYTVYGNNRVAYCSYSSDKESIFPVTEVMISHIGDYWNTTSFRKNKKS